MELSIIGAGRLGGALAIALDNKGYQIVNVVSRRLESAKKLAAQLQSRPQTWQIEDLNQFSSTQIVFITTPDPEIENTAVKLAALPVFAQRQTIFLHTSGSLSSEVLAVLRERGSHIGSLHPLVSVSSPAEGAANFENAYFCLEGDAAVIQVAEKIVADLGGKSFSIAAAQKPLYHAAAVMSAGHLVALFDVAAETLADCGIERELANQILLPLISSAVANLKKQAPAAALTGTFARADAATMRNHLAALAGKNALPVYLELGKRSLLLAAEQGADTKKLDEMLEELKKTAK